MSLSFITRYTCSSSFGFLDASSYNNQTVLLYQKPGFPESIVLAFINSTNTKCTELEVSNTYSSFFYPKITFFNSSNVAIIVAQGTFISSTIQYYNIDIRTGYRETHSICNKDCRGLGISSSSLITSIIWNSNNNNCASVHAINFLGNKNTTFTFNTSCASYDWQQAIVVNGNTTIAAWVEKNTTANAHTIKAQILPWQPLSVSTNINNAFSPQIASTTTTTGIIYSGTTPGISTNIFFRALNLNGTFTTPEIPILNVTTAQNIGISGLHGVFVITYNVINYNLNYNYAFVQLIRHNGTLIGQPLFLGNLSKGSTEYSVRTVSYNNSFTFIYPEQYNQTLVLSTRELDISKYIDISQEKDTAPTQSLSITTTQSKNFSHTKHNTKPETTTESKSKSISASHQLTHTESSQITYALTENGTFTHTISTSFTGAKPQHNTIPPNTSAPTALTISTPLPLINITQLIPTTVTVAAENSASIASAASIATLSPNNIALIKRNQLITKISSCDLLLPGNRTEAELVQYGLSTNPLQLSIGHDNTRFASGTFIGNLILYTVFAITALFIAPILIPKIALSLPIVLKILPHLPSAFIVADVFLTPSLANVAIVLIRFSPTTFWQAAGYTSFVLQALKVCYLGYQLKIITATFSDKWLFSDQQSKKLKHIVQDYRKTDTALSPHIIFPILEQLINIETGTLEGWLQDKLQCPVAKYITASFSITYAILTTTVRPYNSKFDNGFYIFISWAQATTSILIIIQEWSPDSKNNKHINNVIEVMPVVVNFALTGKTVIDIGSGVYKLCKTPKPTATTQQNTQGVQHNLAVTTGQNDNASPLLKAPTLNTHTAVTIQNDNTHVSTAPALHNPLTNHLHPPLQQSYDHCEGGIHTLGQTYHTYPDQ
jgi:hypothetical protein